jgi:hypothetical protein
VELIVAGTPALAAGVRLAVRLYKLVFAVWLLSIAIFVPAQTVVELAAGPARAKLPATALAPDENLVVTIDILQPIAIPLAVAVVFGVVVLLGWWVLWHAGTVRWWMGAPAARVRLVEIMSHGLVLWWRYARLALIAAAALAGVLVLEVVSTRAVLGGEGPLVYPVLVLGVVLTLAAAVVIWLATLHGAWLLGESGRRSALVAWARGLAATVRRPLRSLTVLMVWAIPGLALLVLPLVLDARAAAFAAPVAWLCSVFCWVALHLSFAPQEPPDEWVRKMQARAAARAAKPREESDHYKTSRIPIQPPGER